MGTPSDPLFPELEFRASFASTAAENRSAFIQFLMDNGHESEAVQFIHEVKQATDGHTNRHDWLRIAERYTYVHWTN